MLAPKCVPQLSKNPRGLSLAKTWNSYSVLPKSASNTIGRTAFSLAKKDSEREDQGIPFRNGVPLRMGKKDISFNPCLRFASTTAERTNASARTDRPTQAEAVEERTTKPVVDSEIIEKGLIYFFYRPKVDHENPQSLDDVKRMYILMWPAAPSIKEDERKMKNYEGGLGEGEPERLLIIAKKRLPDVNKHERFYGFVDRVSHRIEDIEVNLQPATYTTKTRGERHVPGARPIGEGVYALVKHGNHTHIAYVLELPEEPKGVQKEFKVEREGSYVVSVKNPNVSSDWEGGFHRSSKKVQYPPELMKHFTGVAGRPIKFASATPKLLDAEGAELIFTGARGDLKTEFGEVGEYLEELEHVDARKLTSDKLWKELHMDKQAHPPEPILEGKWT
jgi:hypothetical protein